MIVPIPEKNRAARRNMMLIFLIRHRSYSTCKYLLFVSKPIMRGAI